ncbi:type VII secretion system-associated protein [Streptomyces sp. NPDC004031]
MTHKADLTKLDAKALQDFIDDDVSAFITDIANLRKAGQKPPALFDLGSSPTPVTMGQMGGDDTTGGKNVVSNAQNAAQAIDKVLRTHKESFEELKKELQKVITTMLKTQGDTLATLDGQKFVDALSGYDFDMNGGDSTGQPPSGSGHDSSS